VISVIRNVSNIYDGRKVKEITNQNMQSTETDKKMSNMNVGYIGVASFRSLFIPFT